MKIFRPDFYLENIFSVTPDFCVNQGIKALLLDVDNTLCIFHTDYPLDGILDWIEKMQESGIKLYILSNAKGDRLKRFAEKVNLPYFYMSMKPLPFKIKKAVKNLNFKRSETALIGDQIFTDILGGNLAGTKTVLLDYIQAEASKFFKIKRYFERKIKSKLKRGDY